MPKGIKGFQKGYPSGVNKGKKFSKKWKENLSKAHKGLPYTGGCTGKHWKLSEKTKIKMSEAKKGEKAPAWKGGICQNKDYISWLKNKRNRMPKIGNHTFGEWELLKKQYGYRCPACGKNESEIKLTQDHIIPLSKGGSDYIENIQPLCRSCNCKKHTEIIKYEI